MIRLTRGQKTVRNYILAVLLALALFASLGFPAYTVKGMCLRFQHDYLLEEEIVPLYVQRTGRRSNGIRARTLILGRSGEVYTIFRYYNGQFLNNMLDTRVVPTLGEGGASAAIGGAIYAAGPFGGAASATATVRLEKIEDGEVQRTRDIVLEGERLSDGAFGFPYGEERAEESLYYWDELTRLEDLPEDYQQFREAVGLPPMDAMEDSLGLASLAEYWYRVPSEGGYLLPSVDLPCTVTLYDEAGGALETFESSVNTSGFWSWW